MSNITFDYSDKTAVVTEPAQGSDVRSHFDSAKPEPP